MTISQIKMLFKYFTTNIEICVDDPIATPNVISCMQWNYGNDKLVNTKFLELKNTSKHTSLSFIANIIALACSAAFPTIGSKITLIKETGMFIDTDAPCKIGNLLRFF